MLVPHGAGNIASLVELFHAIGRFPKVAQSPAELLNAGLAQRTGERDGAAQGDGAGGQRFFSGQGVVGPGGQTGGSDSLGGAQQKLTTAHGVQGG